MASVGWKSRSGRLSGPESYQFGDVTRSLFTRRRSWSEKSGRKYSGDLKEGYRFGDVSRTIFGVATAVTKDVTPIVQSLLNNRIEWRDTHQNNNGAAVESQNEKQVKNKFLFVSFNDMMQQISMDGGYTGDTVWPQSPLAQSIWVSFINASYEVSKEAQRQNILDREDLVSSEPYLFLGIPALTALECSLRSLHQDGMVLLQSSSSSMTNEYKDNINVPIPWETNLIDTLSKDEKNLFNKLKYITKLLENRISELSSENIQNLRIKVVHASGDAAKCNCERQDVLANQICSLVIDIATDVSQLYFFQKAFMLVMTETLEA